MRCFIGIDVPENIKEYLSGIMQAIEKEFRNAGYRFSIVKKENIHVTLAFLGESGENGLKRIAEIASFVAAKFNAFECSLSKIEAFPEKMPRLIWVSLDSSRELSGLYSELSRALNAAGISEKKEGHSEFRAHITLARIKRAPVKPREGTLLAEIVSKIEIKPLKAGVHEIKIMQSILKKEGPKYVLIKSLPLIQRREIA